MLFLLLVLLDGVSISISLHASLLCVFLEMSFRAFAMQQDVLLGADENEEAGLFCDVTVMNNITTDLCIPHQWGYFMFFRSQSL